MQLLWLSMQKKRALGQELDSGFVSRSPARPQHARRPALLVESLLVLLLCVLFESSSVLRAETPILPRCSPPPQAPALDPATRAAGEPAPTGPVAGVTLQDNRLSVDIQEQDLRAVLETIATQEGIEVRHAEGLPNTCVSVRFAALPVLDGLKRLFRVADVTGYALITETAGEDVKVRRILFLPGAESGGSTEVSSPPRRPPPMSQLSAVPPGLPAPEPNLAAPAPPGAQPAKGERHAEAARGGSVFDNIKNPPEARWLLSQLVHANEQVRERTWERLVQLVDDSNQAELLETLKPLMDRLSSDDQATRDDARAELHTLLNQ